MHRVLQDAHSNTLETNHESDRSALESVEDEIESEESDFLKEEDEDGGSDFSDNIEDNYWKTTW